MMIISHNHWDHIGGASWLVKQNPYMDVYIPKTYGRLKNKFKPYTNKVNVIDKNTVLSDNLLLVISKKRLITEISLTIKTDNGNVVFTGCSHAGVENIAKQVIALTETNVLAIIGGLHFFRSFQPRIKRSIKEMKALNIKRIVPSHCTGKRAILCLKKEFGENCSIGGVGTELNF
jgi:7,8-dihydropterin-6-yl-methyl-4-(beta-D-ribofuranosyl)aminobenzene 5'-phosphate synthase